MLFTSIDARERSLGNRDTEKLTKWLPAIGHVVHEEPVLRHCLLHCGGVLPEILDHELPVVNTLAEILPDGLAEEGLQRRGADPGAHLRGEYRRLGRFEP